MPAAGRSGGAAARARGRGSRPPRPDLPGPDLTSTHGKKPDEAKALELAGWPFPRHLSGRGRYIGYYDPYATSHEALDRDEAVQEDGRNVARAVVATVRLMREGRYERPDRGVRDPRPK